MIGGNAKTVIAAFVSDASFVSVYKSDSADFDAGADTGGVTYRIAVCQTGEDGNVTEPGTVTAPAAPTKEGYDFAAWRGFAGTSPEKTEKIYSAGDDISVRENTTLNAIWNRKNPSVKLNLNDGTGGNNVTSVDYGDALPDLGTPAKSGFVFDGWTVGETVTEDGRLFAKGSFFRFEREDYSFPESVGAVEARPFLLLLPDY